MIKVSAKFSDFEPGWDDNEPLVKKKVPNQKKPLTKTEELQVQQAEEAGEYSVVVGIGVIIANLLSTGAMS